MEPINLIPLTGDIAKTTRCAEIWTITTEEPSDIAHVDDPYSSWCASDGEGLDGGGCDEVDGMPIALRFFHFLFCARINHFSFYKDTE